MRLQNSEFNQRKLLIMGTYIHISESKVLIQFTKFQWPVERYHTFLTKGWNGFRSRKSEDAIPLLGKLWVIDGSSLIIKRWRVGFDPSREYFHIRYLWVLLLGLPFQLWNKRALEALGNNMGRFIAVDE
jgi:hypothetical protein